MSEHEINRRDFLRQGALLSAGAALTLPHVASAARLDFPAALGSRVAPADSLVVVRLLGGVASQDWFDPKPFTPFRRGMRGEELLASCPSIPTAAKGVRLGAGLEHLAAVMDRACVLRAIVDPAAPATHDGASQRLLEALDHASGSGGEQWRVLHSEPSQAAEGLFRSAAERVSQGERRVRIDLGGEPFAGFDTHEHGASRTIDLKGSIDGPLARFVRELEEAGRLDRTILLVISEFGRTIGPARPSHVSTASAGIDRSWHDDSEYGFHAHLPGQMCGLLFGGGFRSGAVIGRTADAHPMVGIAQTISLTDLAATIRHVCHDGGGSPSPFGAVRGELLAGSATA